MNLLQPKSKLEHPRTNSEVWTLESFARSSWLAWLGWLLLPLPAVLFWRSDSGRFIALCLFFVSSTSFVANAFRANTAGPAKSAAELADRKKIWRVRTFFLAMALLFQWVVFSMLCLVFNDQHDVMAPVLALGSLVPSLSIAPCLTLVTRKPFAAVVLTLFLVGSMKILGCVVVVLVHGWHADAQGYTTLPWTHPNLLVWFFWLNTSLLSLSFYIFGWKKFIRDLAWPPRPGWSNVRC